MRSLVTAHPSLGMIQAQALLCHLPSWLEDRLPPRLWLYQWLIPLLDLLSLPSTSAISTVELVPLLVHSTRSSGTMVRERPLYLVGSLSPRQDQRHRLSISSLSMELSRVLTISLQCSTLLMVPTSPIQPSLSQSAVRLPHSL